MNFDDDTAPDVPDREGARNVPKTSAHAKKSRTRSHNNKRIDSKTEQSRAAPATNGDEKRRRRDPEQRVGGEASRGTPTDDLHDHGPVMVPMPRADAELVARVRAAGTSSPEYRYLKQALEEVAMGTMTNLDKKKQLHREVMRKGCALRRPVPFAYPAHFRTLLTLAVLTASPKFMDTQIIGGGWQPTGNATVRTFFVSAAMFQFAAEYNRFWREENPSIQVSAEDLDGAERPDSDYLTARYGLNPEDLVVSRDRIAQIVDEYLSGPKVHPKLAQMIVQTAQQYTQAEIAENLGLSSGEAVSSAIRRFRARLQ